MKRTLTILAILIVTSIVCGWIGQQIEARNAEKRWGEFVSYWESKGESFELEITAHNASEKSDNFLKHHFVTKVLRNEVPLLVDFQRNDFDAITGFNEWKSRESGVNDEGAAMPVEVAKQVLKFLAQYDEELTEFSAATDLTHCLIHAANPEEMLQRSDELSKLSSLPIILSARASARIALGDLDAATSDIEALLRAGKLLRSMNSALAIVVGCNFEAEAYTVIRSLPSTEEIPRQIQRRILDALLARDRPLERESAAMLRYERNLFLATCYLSYPTQKLPTSAIRLRRFIAALKLARCQELQTMVLSDGGKIVNRADPASLRSYNEFLDSQKSSSRPAENFGYAAAEVLATLPRSIAFMDSETREPLIKKFTEQLGTR